MTLHRTVLKSNPSHHHHDGGGVYESEDESIVYGNQEEVSFSVSHHHDHDDSSQTQDSLHLLSPQPLAGNSLVSAPSRTTTTMMIMTREERRKRRRIWKDHQHEQQQQQRRQEDDDWSSCSSSHEGEANNEPLGPTRSSTSSISISRCRSKPQTTESAFASLQALLQDDISVGSTTMEPRTDMDPGTIGPPSCTTRQDTTTVHKTLYDTPPAIPTGPTHGTPRILTRPPQVPRPDEDSAEPSSPPDFADHFGDNDNDNHDENTHDTSSTFRKATRKDEDWVMSTSTTKKHVGGPRAVSQRQTAPSQPPPPRRRHSSFHHRPVGSTTSWQTDSSPRKCTTAPISTHLTQDDSNIVGLRPTHWKRPRTLQARPPSGFLRSANEQLQAAARIKALRAATMRPSTTAIVSTTVALPPAPPSRSNDWMAAAFNNHNHNHNNNALASERFTTEQLRTMTFRPRTMPQRRNEESLSKPSGHNSINNDDEVSIVDTVDDKDDDDDDNQSRTPLRPNGTPGPTTNTAVIASCLQRQAFSSPTPPRRKRTSKTHTGPWTKRFATIKSNQASDVLKLQHTFMNRHGISLIDLNDPRRKAKTFTDVTILAQEDCHGVALPIGWSGDANSSNGNQHNEGLRTVLCYLHNHGPMYGGNPASPTRSNTHGWISFTRPTARSIGLRKELTLRLYDAIVLPMRRMGWRHSDSEEQCTFIAICTQLCERHPGTLDPVSHLM